MRAESHGTRRCFVLFSCLLLACAAGCTDDPGYLENEASATEALLAGDCAEATTLNALVRCIRAQMPRSDSNGYVPPTQAQRSELRDAVRRMMKGECDFQLGSSIASPMRVRTFTDAAGHAYCLLMEVRDADGDGVVDRGLGTFIVNPSATRQIVQGAPHPISDFNTELQAVDVFEATESRALLICGAERDANSAKSTCQPSYGQADCAHETRTMFFAATQEIEAYYAGARHVTIQWHGMSPSTCPGVNAYLAEGLTKAPAPISRVPELRAAAMSFHGSWNIDMTGDGTCNLNATENVEGRLVNGVPATSVCTTKATASTGVFISVEQQPNYRDASDWITPVKNTFPTVVPPPPSDVVAQAKSKAIRISWTPPQGTLEGFDVSRSLSPNGPFTVIAHVDTGTSYTDTGLSSGTRRYYVVRASSFAGTSAPSSIVSAVPK